jgi:hypothetical protein
LVVRAYTEQSKHYRAAMADATDPGDQLVAFAATYVQFAADQPALFELTFAAGLDKARFPHSPRPARPCSPNCPHRPTPVRQ